MNGVSVRAGQHSTARGSRWWKSSESRIASALPKSELSIAGLLSLEKWSSK